MQDKITLGYWALRARGTMIRLALEYTGASYVEKRYSFETAPTWFGDHKQSLGIDLPNMPYMIDGEQRFSESNAMMRHIARKFKPEMLGNGPADEARHDQVFEVLADFTEKLYEFVVDRAFEENRAKNVETISVLLGKLDAFIGPDSPFIVGDYITLVDLLAHDLFERIDLIDKALLPQFPNVVRARESLLNAEWLQTYKQSPKWIDKPLNGPTAVISDL